MAHPVLVVVCGVLAAALAVGWSWDRVRLDANTDSLMGNDRPYVAEYKRFLREFGDLEYAWIVIDSKGNAGQARYAVDLLETALHGDPSLEAVNATVRMPEQMRLATWAMTTPELEGRVRLKAGQCQGQLGMFEPAIDNLDRYIAASGEKNDPFDDNLKRAFRMKRRINRRFFQGCFPRFAGCQCRENVPDQL